MNHCDGCDCPSHGAGRPRELLLVTERTADTRPQIDEALVRRLVDTQFPQWAGLALKLLNPAGSDHVIYRLGEELSVRLPRHPGAIGQARKEFQ
ncbi:aminoglycoside phosphotransferase (APT) family kinase protein [Streptomyces sp. SAI-163]